MGSVSCPAKYTVLSFLACKMAKYHGWWVAHIPIPPFNLVFVDGAGIIAISKISLKTCKEGFGIDGVGEKIL